MLKALPGPDGTPGSDRVRLARVHYWMGWLNWIRNAIPEAIQYFSQVLPIAQEIGDPELLAMSSAAIGVALSLKGQMAKAEPLLRQGMTALEQTGNLKEWVRAMATHGAAVASMGDYAAGVAEIQRAIAHAREMGSTFLSGWAQFSLARSLLHCGDPIQAIEVFRKQLEEAEEMGLQAFVYLGYGHQALAEARAGRFEAAQASMAKAQVVAEQLGGRLMLADFFLAGRAEIALGTGRIQEAQDLAEQAANIAQKTGSPAAEATARRVWGQVLASMRPPRWNEVETQFAESLRLFESLPMTPEAALTHLVWGSACRDREDLVRAREHWEQAANLWEGCGITWELERVRVLIETLPEA
jgi:tetratricopeptide (TPR) repeat protein